MAHRGETVAGSSRGVELSSGGGSPEMISDGCSDSNGKALVKGVGEHLLPSAQSGGLLRPGPSVAAPGTGNRHIDLLGQVLRSLRAVIKAGMTAPRTEAAKVVRRPAIAITTVGSAQDTGHLLTALALSWLPRMRD
jgi:hypothetical protein